VFDINVAMFCAATLVNQGVKFFLLALLIIKIGPGIKKLLEFRLKPVAIVVTVSVVLAILLMKAF